LSASGGCAGVGFVSSGGPGALARSGFSSRFCDDRPDGVFAVDEDGIPAYRRFQLRLRMIMGVRGFGRFLIERRARRGRLRVVIELVHGISAHLAHRLLLSHPN
jgi:hypothetical protein